jgi:hypothetical protein
MSFKLDDLSYSSNPINNLNFSMNHQLSNLPQTEFVRYDFLFFLCLLICCMFNGIASIIDFVKTNHKESNESCTDNYKNCKRMFRFANIICGCLFICVALLFGIMISIHIKNDPQIDIQYKVNYTLILLLVICQSIILFYLDKKTCYFYQSYLHTAVILSNGFIIGMVFVYTYFHDYIKK